MRRIFFALSFFVAMKASAEIERVIITWDAIQCKSSCVAGLEKRFAKVPGVQAVKIDEGGGRAELTWKESFPFSFVPINWALRYIGIRERDVRVKVKGKIQVNNRMYYLVSDKDKTSFQLLNAATAQSSSQYVSEFNVLNRGLTESQIQEFSQAKAKNAFVEIEGSLFMPERSPPDPLRLIIGVVRIEEPKKDKTR